MGSSCVVKNCSSKKLFARMSYHRLPSRFRQNCGSLAILFGRNNIRDVTQWSRICTQHLTVLQQHDSSDETSTKPQNQLETEVLNNCFGNEILFTSSQPDAEVSKSFFESALQNNSIRIQDYEVKEELSLNWLQNLETEIADKELKDGVDFRSEMDLMEPIYNEKNHAAKEDIIKMWRRVLDNIAILRSYELIGKSMIADVLRPTMDSTTECKEEEEKDGTRSPTPTPPNGEVGHEERFLGAKDDEEGHLSSEDEDKLVINENCHTVKKEEPKYEDAKIPVSCPSSGTCPSTDTYSSTTGDAVSPKSHLKRPAEDVESGDAHQQSLKKVRLCNASNEGSLDDGAETPPSLTKVEESLAILRNDLQGIELLLLQKEEEWNAILRLQKKKEEMYSRLSRKKQVLKMRNSEGVLNNSEGGLAEGDSESDDTNEPIVFLPHGAYSALGSSQFPLMMMKQMVGDTASMPSVLNTSKSSYNKDPVSGPSLSSQSNISVIDIHTSNSKSPSLGGAGSEPPQISISPETQSKLGMQLNSMMTMKPILPKPPKPHCVGGGKPILPKPPNCVGGASSMPPGGGDGMPQLPYSATGYGPQGPTISVHHLIAAHRKENPYIPPIRGAKRGAWRHRYEGETKRSSSREPDRPSSVSSSNSETDSRLRIPVPPSSIPPSAHNNNHLLAMKDPSVSYKDVLLQFAQLTQTEKQPGSPQISIIPVSSGETSSRKLEPIPDSTSVSRELPAQSHQTPSQSQNLEGSSALAKLLLESGVANQSGASKSAAVDLSSYNSSSPHCLTLSALLSGGTTTTVKDNKPAATSQMEARPKKSASNTEDSSNTNPKCQGCHKHRAQFVCAGCGNQWYCSRNCQVTAWEKHSEHCNS